MSEERKCEWCGQSLEGKISSAKVCSKSCGNKKWRAENRGKVGEYRRVRDPEKERARLAKWKAQNPEKVRASQAKWRAQNPEKEKARKAKWQAQNPEKARAAVAKWQAQNPDKVQAIRLRRRRKSLASAAMQASIMAIAEIAKLVEAQS